MPIVIKEVVVKTTVEKSSPKWTISDRQLIDSLKQIVWDELHTESKMKEFGYGKSEGKNRR